MFGHKDAGLMETLLRFRAHDDAVKSARIREKAEAGTAEAPFEVPLRRETYFAVASSFRWNR